MACSNTLNFASDAGGLGERGKGGVRDLGDLSAKRQAASRRAMKSANQAVGRRPVDGLEDHPRGVAGGCGACLQAGVEREANGCGWGLGRGCSTVTRGKARDTAHRQECDQ